MDDRQFLAEVIRRIAALERQLNRQPGIETAGGGAGHSAVTLAADADAVLSLTGQQVGLDTQAANTVLAGPTSGGAADPAFRALVDADIPAAIARDGEVTTAISDHAAAADPHTGYALEANAAADLAAAIHAATSKATPVDADELALVDSAASNVLKKLTWANLKANVGANVWPKAGKLNISDVEYSTAAAALAALGAGDQLLVGEGSFSCDNQSTAENVAIRGAGLDVAVLTVADAAAVLTLSGTALDVQELTLAMTAATTAGATALVLSGSDAQVVCRSIKAAMTSAAGGTYYALDAGIGSSGVLRLIGCDLTGVAGGGGTVYALQVASGLTRLEGGRVTGNIRNLATLELDGPVITGTITNSGTISGWYVDAGGSIWAWDGSVFVELVGAAAAASEGAAGIAELATQAETDDGDDDARIVTSLKLGQAATVQPKIVKNLLYHSLTHDLWQQGTTFNDIADDTYVADLWNVVHNGQTPDVSGQAGGASDPFSRYFNCTFDSASSQAGIVHFLTNRDTVPYRGEVVSLSADLWGTNITSLRMAVLEWAGTADSLTSDVVGTWGAGNPTLAANWSYIGTPAAITIDGTRTRYAVEGLTVGASTNNLAVFIWTDAVEASGDLFNVVRVQLERGPVATEFVARSYGIEELLIKQFLRFIPAGGLLCPSGYTTSTSTASLHLQFEPPMFKTPTLLQSGTAGDYSVSDSAAVNTALTSVPTLAFATNKILARVLATTAATMTANRPAVLQTSAGQPGYLGFDARL